MKESERGDEEMRVLIACEESQVVCNAFRAKGHDAFSCDILPTRGEHPEWHIKDNILNVFWNNHFVTQTKDLWYVPNWDIMIGHPECKYLTNSGVCWLYNKDGSKNIERWNKLELAREFFLKLWNADTQKICLENPIPHKYARLPKYTQIIQPWMFGYMEQKATCLWLKGLPKLEETNNVYDEMMKLPDNKRQRIHYLPPSPTRQRDRSVTYAGIGKAMAEQWNF